MIYRKLFAVFGCCLFSISFSNGDDLSVLPADLAPENRLEEHLLLRAEALLDKRGAAFEQLNGLSACEEWRQERRSFFLRQLGEFPERTPLNANVVGHLDGEGYRIEKVMFESRPDHHVTANLYLPKQEGPFPAVLVPCGHSHSGKAAGQYQRICILLAQNGIAAFCYDPAGQGERYQMIDRTKDHTYFLDIPSKLKTPHPRVKYLCTTEHTVMGLGCILLGSNFAQFRIWDGMRSIDYLQSRKDIVADKIGCTGNSGGGTLTTYLLALDDRIVAASPGCFLTTFYKLLRQKGPQDAEQNIFDQIRFGMNEADYLLMRSTVPTLICASTRDATFDIGGAREVFHQAQRFHSRLGDPELIAINEADAPHGFYIQHREAVVRWMTRWLLGQEKVIREIPRSEWPDPVNDEFLRSLSEEVWTAQELQCSPEGQVLLMEGERSVFDFNTEIETQQKAKRDVSWAGMNDSERSQLVRKSLGVVNPVGLKIVKVDSLDRNGYTIEKLILKREGKIPLPALAFIPEGEVRKGNCLYIHGEGKVTEAAIGGQIEEILKRGMTVLAPDLTGIGETMTERRGFGYGRFGPDVTSIFTAYLIGDSFVRMRAEDTLAWSKYFEGKGDIELVALGEAAIPALHAAAIERELFKSVTLRNMIKSWREVVASNEDGYNQAVNVFHGALKHYDLPDLVGLTGAITIDPVKIDWKVSN